VCVCVRVRVCRICVLAGTMYYKYCSFFVLLFEYYDQHDYIVTCVTII